MIEFQVDASLIQKELARLGGIQHRMALAVKTALRATAPQIRRDVIGVLEKDVTVGKKFIRRAVKTVRDMNDGVGFKIVSKSLFLDDYELDPRMETAVKGARSKNWPGFFFRFRKDGKRFHSSGTLTGSDGGGSTPFVAKTQKGHLRVMYRRKDSDEVFLAYAPSIQYHAMAPHVHDAARMQGQAIFHKELTKAVDAMLEGKAI